MAANGSRSAPEQCSVNINVIKTNQRSELDISALAANEIPKNLKRLLMMIKVT